jgi:hypothetical protein
MIPRPLDPASLQGKLRSLDELVSALGLVGNVDGARLERDVLLWTAAPSSTSCAAASRRQRFGSMRAGC